MIPPDLFLHADQQAVFLLHQLVLLRDGITFIIFYLTSTISHPTNAAGISAKMMPGKSIPFT